MSLQNILNALERVKKTGNSYVALCPVHGDKNPSLSITEKDNKVIANCFSCGANGVDVVQAIGLDISELFNEELKKMTETRAQYQTAQEQEWQKNRVFLDDIAKRTAKITGHDCVTKYLNSRGITKIPPTIRYLDSYYQDGQTWPCLIARLDDNALNRVSYKVIHLTQDGKKAPVENVKKTLPVERPMTGCSAKLFKHSGVLAVAEGIETALIYTQKIGIPAWALDNANNMAQFDVPADVVQLTIVADMDSGFTGQAAAYTLAKRASRLIGKDGYQLEEINVQLILPKVDNFELFEIRTDYGQKIDFLDFANK